MTSLRKKVGSCSRQHSSTACITPWAIAKKNYGTPVPSVTAGCALHPHPCLTPDGAVLQFAVPEMGV